MRQELWLNDNALADLPVLLGRLAELRGSLVCLYLAGNPATPDMAAVQVRSARAALTLFGSPSLPSHCPADGN